MHWLFLHIRFKIGIRKKWECPKSFFLFKKRKLGALISWDTISPHCDQAPNLKPLTLENRIDLRSRGSSHRSWFRAAGLLRQGHGFVCELKGCPPIMCYPTAWFSTIFVGLMLCAGNTDFMSVTSANRLARRIAYLTLTSLESAHLQPESDLVFSWTDIFVRR